jgi:hypothetical protein
MLNAPIRRSGCNRKERKEHKDSEPQFLVTFVYLVF